MNLKIILKNISQIKTKEISPTQIYSTLLINTTLMIIANPKMASLMIGYLMATSPHSKPKDSFLDMIYSFINQIPNLDSLLPSFGEKRKQKNAESKGVI